jgi:hypothetical protein
MTSKNSLYDLRRSLFFRNALFGLEFFVGISTLFSAEDCLDSTGCLVLKSVFFPLPSGFLLSSRFPTPEN